GDGATADERRRRIETQRSILDAVTSQVRRLQGGLGAGDRNRVSEYLDTVREIERRIELSEKRASDDVEVPITPRGIPDDFRSGDGATADERRRRIETQRSILDAVTSQVRRLQGGLGAGDRNRVSEYLDTVREIERRIELSEKRASDDVEVPITPRGIPDDF